MGIIKIIQGQEFKYIRDCYGNNDIFFQQYNLAARCLEEIVHSNSEDFKEGEDCLNNIISFTGGRGQGKTTAMLTFTKELMKVDSQIHFGENTKKAEFLELELVDPSTFEDMHNIVEVIVTKMYNAYVDEYRHRKEKNTIRDTPPEHGKILKVFQLVYEGLSLVRNARKFDDLEQDYEGTISKITRAGDSAKLKKNMQDLVDQYLNFFKKDKKRYFLIVPIDDLDVNISLAYKMMEQIRKYLILPNVILIMAVKTDQLRYCVELQFRKEMALLIEKKQRLLDQEPIDMAVKYVAKLIPDARRIALPELRLLVNKNEEQEPLDVEYIIDGKNLFSSAESADANRSYTFETRLLTKIYEFTSLVFVRSEKQVHPLVPQTLRELVNFVSVLGKMEPTTSLENLERFEAYFLNTWVPTQLDDGYVQNIHALFQVQTPALHLMVCSILLDKLENLKAYTLETLERENEGKAFNSLKKVILEKSQSELSLGDVVGLLNFFGNHYTDQTVKLFAFAIRTVYSIIMCKMSLSSRDSELATFVGSSVFGKDVIVSKYSEKYEFSQNLRIDDMAQSNASEGYSRVDFFFNSKGYLDVSTDYLSKAIEKQQSEKIHALLYFCSFGNNFKYFISGNRVFEKKPNFLLENLFVSPLYDSNNKFAVDDPLIYDAEFDWRPKKEVICKVTTNLELLDFLYKYCSDRKDPREAAADADHIVYILKNLNNAAKKYLFEELFSPNCIEWITTNFKNFWACRIATDAPLDNEAAEILYRKIEQQKLRRICVHPSFQQRIKDVLELCENDGLSKHENFPSVLQQLESMLASSKAQNINEKIDGKLRSNFNDRLDDLLKILKTSDKKGDET